MTPQQVSQLLELINSHPKHTPYTKLERIAQLERMSDFYATKSEVAPAKQQKQFAGYIATLEYAVNTIKLYDQLTNGLLDLTAGVET